MLGKIIVQGAISLLIVATTFNVVEARPITVNPSKANISINRLSPEENFSLDKLALESDAISLGKVTEIESYWNGEHDQIYSVASVSVEKNLKSKSSGKTISIAFPGGEIDGLGQWVSDTPTLLPGGRAVFFLDNVPATEYPNVAELRELPELYAVHGGFRGSLTIKNEMVGQLPLEEFENRVTAVLSGKQLSPSELDIPLYESTRPYSFSGQSWPHPPSPNISYRINENSVDCAGEGAAVQAAAATWNAAGAFFSFTYGGATGVTQSAQNYVNEILWADLGSGGTVALTTYWYVPASGQIVECDMEFNTYYTWSTAATTPSNCMDVQTVALHEFGHFLCLEDLYSASDNAKVMYGYVSDGQMKRSLHTDDIAGIKSTYGPLVPVVTNSAGASAVSGTTARLNGYLESTGGQNPSVNIYYGTADGGTIAGNWQKHADLGAISAGSFFADVSALTPGAAYFYRCYAANSAGGVWASSSAAFSTPVILPTITNGSGATGIGPTGARLNGQVTSTGGNNPVVYIYYGKNDGGTVQGNWQNNVNLGAKSAGVFYTEIDPLTPDTNYYYRCYGVNTAGGTWASQTSAFSTESALPPALVTNNATLITTNSAVLNGRLTDFGTASSVEVSFEWGLTDNYTATTEAEVLSSLASFTANITGLNPGTIYHYRAVAVGGATGYGDDMSLRTIPIPTFNVIPDNQDNWYNQVPIISSISFSDIEGLDSGWYQIDSFGGSWAVLYSSCNATTWDITDWAIPNFDLLSEGEHTVYFKANNDAGEEGGNSGEWKWNFNKDTISPLSVDNMTSSTHVAGIWSKKNVIGINWDAASDNGSGVAGYSILWDTSPTTEPDEINDVVNISSINSTSLADGTGYYFHIRPIDNAGNLGTAKHIGPFSIDSTAPSGPTGLASPSHAVGMWSENRTPTVTWNPAIDSISGLAGYSVLWDSLPETIPQKAINTNNTTAESTDLLDDGFYYFHIMAADVAGNWAPAQHFGPLMINAYSPVLSGGSVTPVSGYTTDEFVFSVAYRDPQGQSPESVSVSIDGGISSNMTLADGQSGNFTETQYFDYRVTSLSPGSHTYAFSATDNDSNQALGDVVIHSGPTVSVQPATPPSGGFGGGFGGFSGGGAVVAGPGETNLSLYTNNDGVFVLDAYAESEDKLIRIDFGKGLQARTKEGDPLKKVKIISSAENFGVNDGYVLLSLAYDIGPTGATFSPSASLTMFYDRSILPSKIDIASIVIAVYDSGTSKWQIIGGKNGNSPTCLYTEISTPGTYALLGKNKPEPTLIKRSLPAQFSISETMVDPVSSVSGETIQISAKVSNTGGMSGDYTVTLKINGNEESVKTVTLDAGKSTILTWSLTEYEAGSNSVDINGLATSFTIIEPEPTIEVTPVGQEPVINKQGLNWYTIAAVICLAVAAVFGTYLFRRKKSA